MQDRFKTLRDEFAATHISLIIEVQGEKQRALVLRDMTVRELREEVVNKFVHETGKKSDYLLVVNNQSLALASKLDTLAPDTLIRLERASHEQTIQDMEIILQFDDGRRISVSTLPAIIGRSKQATINLGDFPNSENVSRRHAELTRYEDRYYIRNLADEPIKKPIYANEIAIDSDIPKEVSNGVVIRLGKISFTLYIQSKI